jgi:hypothetical protein
VPLVWVVLLEAFGAPIAVSLAKWAPAGGQPYGVVISETIRSDRWRLLGLLLAAAGALCVTIRVARAHQWLGIFASLWGATALILVAVRVSIMPGIAAHQTVRDFMADVRRVVGPSGDLSFYKVFDYGAVFYWHGHIPEFDGPWPAGAPDYLLVRKSDWPQLRETAQGAFEAVSLPADRAQLADLVLIHRRGGQ